MSRLIKELDEYLALRRALGAKLVEPERQLRNFVAYLAHNDERWLTTELAVRWATRPATGAGSYYALRFRSVRRFASFLHAKDARHEVPPAGLLSERPRRATPHLYSENEIQALLRAAESLTSPHPLRGRTHATILSLLVVTGMRVSEALALDCDDVDLAAGVVTVRRTKFDRSRLVPLHPTSRDALRSYAHQRHAAFPLPRSRAFFLSDTGTRIAARNFRRTFARLSVKVGLRGSSKRRGPRLHDFRHRFAVENLLRWYRQDLDAARLLPVLSTYLGHVHVADTYWYLGAVPELLGLAARKVERRSGGQP